MQTSIIGFPRIGKQRELKFILEKYFRHEATEAEVRAKAAELRKEHWRCQRAHKITYQPSNDFSYYDNMLDTAVLFHAVPDAYRQLGLGELDTYFAMARGYQGKEGDVPALAMKKWFNTNYHYLVPELSDHTRLELKGEKPFAEYLEAKELGIETKPVLIGPYTFLKLAKYQGKKQAKDFAKDAAAVYIQVLKRFAYLKCVWIQFDEPALVMDMTKKDIALFEAIYREVLKEKGTVRVLLQTYFGDVRDCYQTICALDFDGIGLDFWEGKKTAELIAQNGFPEEKVLFAGLINGKNIWKSNYKKVLEEIAAQKKMVKKFVLSASCSLLHVPYTLESEEKLPAAVKNHFSFAVEKLQELSELAQLAECAEYASEKTYAENQNLFLQKQYHSNPAVQKKVAELTEKEFVRTPERAKRQALQKSVYGLPLFPTTTISSFPQTAEVKKNRSRYRKGEIDKIAYDRQIETFIRDCIEKQEEIGLDVLVHGEYERNDMVEFFGENLEGYVFTEKGWVQSYGTRCVKPPVIFGDVCRKAPVTVSYAVYAQNLTKKPVKGMLTGPVTILNWSFPREDISLKEMAYQIGLAIREEVLDLEKAGIQIIQIDEAALKEKLPIRKSDWYTEYLDWAIPAFRLCHSGVKPETQIHTHMCYSEFDEMIQDIDNMDADVITFEASRSKLTILDAIWKSGFETEVGPGVYDIHSPRVPSVEEMADAIRKMLTKVKTEKLWVNPDCGLKTRGTKEAEASLKNMVAAAKKVRAELQAEN